MSLKNLIKVWNIKLKYINIDLVKFIYEILFIIFIFYIKDRLSFGVGRLVGSPATRSPSPSRSPSPDSLHTENRDADIDVDVEDEEVDVDVEEVGDEDEREATSSPTRSPSPPSPASIPRITLSSHPPKR